MKILYLTNKVALIITAILYLTVIFGLYAQIVLGAIQIISAIGLLFLWNTIPLQSKKQLIIYWTIVILYGIGWKIELALHDFWWIGVVLIPMGIAIYFVWILNNLKTVGK